MEKKKEKKEARGNQLNLTTRVHCNVLCHRYWTSEMLGMEVAIIDGLMEEWKVLTAAMLRCCEFKSCYQSTHSHTTKGEKEATIGDLRNDVGM